MRLLARVLLFSLAITLLLTGLQLYLAYRRDVGTIESRMSEIAQSYHRSLGEGLWNLDSRQLALQADGILHLPDIGFVEVREATDRADPMVVTAGSRRPNAGLERNFPIFHTYRGAEQQLGVLSIEATLDRVYRRLFDTAMVILISQGAEIFFVSFFILLIVHELVTRHLIATANFLSAYDLRSPPLRLERRPPLQADELDQLVRALNGMCASLKEGYDELREIERRYREIAAELAHANRLAAMGQLTASIAHEVNQPVAATVTNAQAALRWLGANPPDLDEARLALGRIVRDGNRAGAVVGRIRDLIKKAPPVDERLDMNAAIREVIELTRSEAVKKGVSVEAELTEGLPLVLGDRVELQQVILNLILNALEAMSEMSEGPRELLITTGKTESGDALVAVRDSGPGLAPDALERLFEAFYTTKPSGLGLGLSICRSIVEAHGGRVWASAISPRGAVFQFTLPARPDSASPP